MSHDYPGSGLADLQARIQLKRLADEAAGRGDEALTAILLTAIRTLDHRLNRTEDLPERSGRHSKGLLTVRNVRVAGRRTSIRLEPDLWERLQEIAANSGRTVHDVCSEIRERNPGISLTSAIRVFIVRQSVIPTGRRSRAA